MNSNGKWIARAGALLVLVGFFLPSVSVSCSAMNVKQALSLSDLASNQNGLTSQTSAGGLFIVLIAALAMMALTFVPSKARSTTIPLIFGQLASVGISVLIIIVTLATLYNQVQKLSTMGGLLPGSSLYSYSLEFGAFILLLGYILAVIGALFQFNEVGASRSPARAEAWANPVNNRSVPAPVPQPVVSAGARLEVVSGNTPRGTIMVGDNFIIGRSRECQVQISDRAVSRQHFRLRCASGAWYLQDMGSAAGTTVNGQPVQAIRLNSGDEIKIGETTLIFKI
jgi:hypothetical protein